MAQAKKRRLGTLAVSLWAVAAVLLVVYLVSSGQPASGPDSTVSQSVSTSSLPPSQGGERGSDAATTETQVPATAGPVTVVAAGDAICDRQVGAYIRRHGGEAPLAKVRGLLRAGDLTFLNLESPATKKGSPVKGKSVTFRGEPAFVTGLEWAGVDVVSLANNHALDYGTAALLDTLSRLKAAGVAAVGAGANLAAARAPAILQAPGGSVAFLAYTDIIPEGFSASAEKAGVNPTRPNRERLIADVRAAADQADYLVVSFHWGIEYQGEAVRKQRELAHDVIDAGADLVLGHHPHVLQGMEIYHNRLIAYSLGDFVFDHYSRKTGEAFILRVRLFPQGPPTLTVTPVYLSDSYGVPAPVTGEEADVILDRLERYSHQLGLDLTRAGDTSVWGSR